MTENKRPSADFVPLEKAVKQSGRSIATLYRFIRTGKLRTVMMPVPGRKPETRVSLSDLERMANSKLLPAARAPVHSHAALAVADERKASKPALAEILAALTATMHHPKSALTIPDAAAVTGLPVSAIKRLVRNGVVDAIKCGRWYVSRVSLEKWINAGFRA